MSPEARLQLAYQVIREQGYTFSNGIDHRPTSNLLNDVLDCDTGSMIVMAIGAELGWPVSLISMEGHMMVRWNSGNGNEDINLDVTDGNIYTQSEIIDALGGESRLPPRILSQDEIVAHSYTNIGLQLASEGNYGQALFYATLALVIEHNNSRAQGLIDYCESQLTPGGNGLGSTVESAVVSMVNRIL